MDSNGNHYYEGLYKSENEGESKSFMFMDHSKQNEQAQQIIDYVVKEVIGRPGIQIDVETPLVSSGLIDSLALVNILGKVEDVTGTRIPASKVQPKDMDTVALMLATAQRLGKPRRQ